MDKKVVFCLENDRVFLDLIKKSLKANYIVLCADDLRSAYNILVKRKDEVDLILLDIMIPIDGLFDISQAKGGVISGILFFEEKIAKEIYEGKRIPPTIFITAFKDQENLNVLGKYESVKGVISKRNLSPSCDSLEYEIQKILKVNGVTS